MLFYLRVHTIDLYMSVTMHCVPTDILAAYSLRAFKVQTAPSLTAHCKEKIRRRSTYVLLDFILSSAAKGHFSSRRIVWKGAAMR